MTNLPHDPYIEALTTAFADVGLDPATVTLDDCDTRGTYRYLRALLHFTPQATYGVTEEQWPDGLLLIWEWHTGIEEKQGEPERGPVWLWAKCLPDGSNTEPTPLPVPGIAQPLQVGWALAELITSGRARKQRIGRWDGAASLESACEAWGAAEAGES